MLDELASFPLRFSDLLLSKQLKISVEAFKNWKSGSLCKVPGCCLDMHYEVNDLCIEHHRCGFEFAKKPPEAAMSAERWLDWPKGVSISVTFASPTAAMGDHCSAEMSQCHWKWLSRLSHFFLFLLLFLILICIPSGIWYHFAAIL